MPLTSNNAAHRLAVFFLLVFAAALPHSIAAAQAAAGLATGVWVVGLIARRQRPVPTRLDLPIALFLLASFLAAVLSLEPTLSLRKLGGTSLVLIVLVTAGLLRTRRQALLLLAVLLGSASLSAARVVAEKIVGRGVDVVSLAPTSPLARANVLARDVLLACDGQKIRGPAHFHQILARHDPSLPLFCSALRTGIIPYRVKILPAQLPSQGSPEAWGYQVKTGRWIRARGTYSHFVTYAEVMLLLAALAAGLWLACPRKRSWTGAGLALLALLLTGALAATFTRSAWAALALAALAMLWMKVRWRGRLALALAAPLLLVGLNALLVEWRGVGFYNPADLSIQYRQMMWADGWRLIGQHPVFGVGMDTMLVRWQELGLRAYDELKLHSHFHSTPIQLAVERGLLGLAAWLLLMGLYVVLLLRLVARTRPAEDWWNHGMALGIFGATAGFLASSLVQYNFGDSEVAMVFWLLAGVALTLDRLTRAGASSSHPG
ncbi:MAG: O-antigen ligase family protein [Terriglobia bacterium]